MDYHNYIDKCYLIRILDNNPTLEKQLESFGIDYEYIDLLDKQYPQQNYKMSELVLKLFFTHRYILLNKLIAIKHHERVMVLENDVLLSEKFLFYFNNLIPELKKIRHDYDFLYLGYLLKETTGGPYNIFRKNKEYKFLKNGNKITINKTLSNFINTRPAYILNYRPFRTRRFMDFSFSANLDYGKYIQRSTKTKKYYCFPALVKSNDPNSAFSFADYILQKEIPEADQFYIFYNNKIKNKTEFTKEEKIEIVKYYNKYTNRKLTSEAYILINSEFLTIVEELKKEYKYLYEHNKFSKYVL